MRKMVCLVLVFGMILGMLPTQVFAAEALTGALDALSAVMEQDEAPAKNAEETQTNQIVPPPRTFLT